MLTNSHFFEGVSFKKWGRTGGFTSSIIHRRMRWTLPHDSTYPRKHPRRSGDKVTHLQDLNSRISFPNSHPIPTQACASDSTSLSQLRGFTLYPSVVLTTLILLICRTTVFHCLGISKDQTFQYSVLMETGGLAFGEGPNRLSLWHAFTRDFNADLPSG